MPYFSIFSLRFILCLMFSIAFLFYACNTGENQKASKVPQETTSPPPIKSNSKRGEFTTEERSYPTLQIDNLVWLGANLDIALSESWCYNTQTTCEELGRLYRWAGAKEACATLGKNWRLPTEAEWQKLANTFGGYTDWLSEQNYGDPVAANEALIKGGSSGFEATLGGWRGSNGGFDSAEKMGFYWTATEANEDEAWFYIVLPGGSKLTRRSTNKRMGMACRCVRKSS